MASGGQPFVFPLAQCPAGSELPLSPLLPDCSSRGPCHNWVRCWQWRVWWFTGTKPMWLVSTLLRLFARCGRSACCAWACLQSFPIIQLTPETYPAVRFSAFATNQHERLKAKVEAPWAFLVSCSPLGDLRRAEHGGRNTRSLLVSHLWHQPALWA